MNEALDNLPLKYKIASNMRALIKEEHYKSGDLLPGELELCKKYNVSRTTIIGALNILKTEGYIFSKQGKGTYVVPQKIIRDLTSYESFYENIANKKANYKNITLECCIKKADDVIAEHINVPIGSDTVFLKRIRCIEGEPVALTYSFIRYDLAQQLLDLDKSHEISIYSFLKEKTGVSPQSGTSLMEVLSIDSEIANLLKVKPGSPACLTTSISYLNNEPFEYAKTILRGDKFRFIIRKVNYKP